MFHKAKVIDDFLTEIDFKELSSLTLKDVKNKEKKVYHNRIYKDGTIESSCIKNETIKRLHSNYHSLAIKILKEYSPQKIELYQYSDFHIVIAGSDFSFPIHSDTPNKLLSGVVYLAPKENMGTTLYSTDKKKSKIIEWKQNRALFSTSCNAISTKTSIAALDRSETKYSFAISNLASVQLFD